MLFRSVIPGNDDALRAVRLFASRIADSIVEGQQIATEGGVVAQTEESAATEETPSTGDESQSPTAGSAVAPESTTAADTEPPSEAAPASEPITESGADQPGAISSAPAETPVDETAESVVAAS